MLKLLLISLQKIKEKSKFHNALLDCIKIKNNCCKLIMSFNLFLYLIVFCLPKIGKSQTFDDKIYFNYSYAPATKFKDIQGKSSVYNDKEIQIGVPPIQLSNRLLWINTFYGRTMNYNFENTHSPLSNISEKFYDIQYRVLFLYKLNPKLFLLGSPTLMVRTDFLDNFSVKDLSYSGILLANYNPDGRGKLIWSLGIVLTNDLSHNQINPAVGFMYKSRKLTAEVSYPRINILYKPSKKIEWGFTAAIDGAIFRSKKIELVDSPTANYVRTVNLFAGQSLNFNLYKRLWLNTQIGYAVLRNYDLMDKNFEAIESTKTDLKGNLFLKTGISLRFGR